MLEICIDITSSILIYFFRGIISKYSIKVKCKP